MSIEPVRLSNLNDLGPLRATATQEGFQFLERLVREWDDGTTRFDGPDEIFVGVYLSGRLVGTAGLSRQKPGLGRVRHVYVHPKHRNQGIASALMAEVLTFAKRHFPTVVLRTSNPEAARLYEALGFVAEVSQEPDFATHRLCLRD